MESLNGNGFGGAIPGLDGKLFHYPSDLVREIADKDQYRICCERQVRGRQNLASTVELFHRKAGTLTEQVSRALRLLERPDTIVLMTAHQPNLFAYGGVLKKIALVDFVQSALEKEGFSSVSIFGVADHDFVHNKWIRTAELAAPLRKEGILRLSMPIHKNNIMKLAKNTAKPAVSVIADWKKQIERWVKENFAIARKNAYENKLNELNSYEDRFSDFWTEVEDAYANSESLADFSSFLVSRLCNSSWGSGTLFYRFTDTFRFFVEECQTILEKLTDYKRVLAETEEILRSKGIDTGLGEESMGVTPFWVECICGSKHSLREGEEPEQLVGKCVRCEKEGTFTIGDLPKVSTRLSPRAVSMLPVHSAALNIACYVGGFGSFGYLVDSKRIARHFGWPFPEVAFWQPKDEYPSLARMCALEEYRRVSRESTGLFGVKLQEIDDHIMHDVESGELLEKQLAMNIRNFRQNFETKKNSNVYS